VDLYLPPAAGRGRRAALEHALREAVRDGRLAAGERLPSTRALARDLGVARGTVVDAYGQLVAEGYLEARPGSATTVARGLAPAAPAAPAPAVGPAVPRADLRPGRPDLSAFPRSAWLRALRAALAAAPDRALDAVEPRGAPELRTELAAYLGRARGVLTSPDLIVVCSGFVQGLRLLGDALRAGGASTVALEDPCQAALRATVAASGLRVAAMAVDERGAEPPGAHADAVVLTPAHQFPLGATLLPDRRAAFARWGAERDALVVEDDYDGEFRYDRPPVGALQGLDPGRIAYAGTASKTLAPGLRLGWLALPPTLVEPVIEAKRRADFGTPVLEQLALAELIASGAYDRHVRQMRLRYRRRRDALMDLLARHAPGVRALGSATGLHVVLAIDGEEQLVARAEARGLAISGLRPFWHDARRAGFEGVVVGYATPPEHGFAAALARLGEVLG
jgi:GntR family transcriptional regulator / MocR family aminotransferase